VVKFKPWLLYAREGTLVPIENEVGWAPERAWTIREEKNLFLLAGIRTPDRLDRSVVAVMLSVTSKVAWLTCSLAEIDGSTLPTAQ
jgi:hypothetical protein